MSSYAASRSAAGIQMLSAALKSSDVSGIQKRVTSSDPQCEMKQVVCRAHAEVETFLLTGKFKF